MDIKESPSGKVINTLAGYQAFIPDPLPPKFEWDNDLVKSLSRADHILGMLSREGAKLPNPHPLMRPFIAREAVLSSRIKGTRATLGEVLAQEAGANVDCNPDDLQKVRNYIAALNYGLMRLQSIPVSLRLIKEIYGRLMQYARPGEFRHMQNWIGAPGCTIDTAKYIPPASGELMDCLYSFEKFLRDKTLPPLIYIALCHYQFEAIHPFSNGNGRIGRLLITLLLIERKLLPSPLLCISAFFEATQSEYYIQLYNINSKGTWHDWFSYFLNGVALQSLDVLSRAEQINNLITDWQSSKTEGVASDIIRYLAVNPYFTIKRIVENLGVAFTTAQRAVMKLEDLGIVSQTSKGKRERVYCATDILKILEEPLPTPKTCLGDYDI
ncbi:Fic family protein [Wolbachia endosymbiont of Ctenocephalides felis wCfeJ]|uniref:Fic family protein n=1 Tax=Wolbachia endosymbiont of Ctenocephalides felis wCfeJ TaxID=2732594 RepID=UPI00144748E7|nr:Fic/DOC family N-terminal domain-containing protein [Wolbachia endosymbiont of Ctenocephalides felis wCfeJ]WCR57729.1 MAG: Adenosine monophosphate-protein transferase SoFic [Wolbachia endosymbiont of Ctenocephalides felis wCfeJ]